MTLDDPARSADVGSLSPADDAAVGRDLDEQCVAKAVERGGWPNLRWEFVLQLERFDLGDRQRTWLRIGGIRCLIVKGHGSEAGSEACRSGANEEVSTRELSRHEVFLMLEGTGDDLLRCSMSTADAARRDTLSDAGRVGLLLGEVLDADVAEVDAVAVA